MEWSNINNQYDHKHGFLTQNKCKGRNLWHLRSKETRMQQWVSDQQVGQSTADCSHWIRSSLTTLPTKESETTSITQRSVRCTSCSTKLIAFVIISHIYILFELYPFLTRNENLQVPTLYTQLYFRANTICSLKIHLEMFWGEKNPTYLSVLEQNSKVF